MFLPSRPCLSPFDPLELDSEDLTKPEASVLSIPNMRRSAVSPLLRRAPTAVFQPGDGRSLYGGARIAF